MKNAIYPLYLALFVLLILPVQGASNDLDKALQALQEKKFTEAKSLLDRMLTRSRTDPGVYYGLSMYYADSDNPANDPFEAYTQATLAEKYYGTIREKDAAALARKGITRQRLQDLQQKTGIDALQQAKTANSLDSLDKVIRHFHALRNIVTLAKDLRDELAFAQVQQANTYQAYQGFMIKYPNARQIPAAQQKYDQLLFESLTASGTIQAYDLFYKNYPDSPYRTQAKELYDKAVYDSVATKNSVEAYQVFLKQHPENAYTAEARQKMELLTMRLPIRVQGKWGYINGFGKVVIQPVFEKAGAFSEGLARVRQTGKWGFIDERGKLTIRPIFDAVKDFSEGLTIVLIKKPGKKPAFQTFYVDINGKPVFEKIYETDGTYMPIHPFREGYAAVEDLTSHKLGFIDKKGNYVIAPLFVPHTGIVNALPNYPFSAFSQGFAWVKEGNSMGLIDKSGKFLLKGDFHRTFSDSASVMPHYRQSFSEGLCPVQEGAKGPVVYVDPAGKKVITLPTGTIAHPFSDSVAWIKQPGETQFTLIDKQGKALIKVAAHQVNAFQWGMATIQKEAPAKRVYFYDETPEEKVVYIDKSAKIHCLNSLTGQIIFLQG